MNGLTAFVTGGTGFVGSHLVEHLLSSGYTDVRCLVRSDPKWLSDLPVTLIAGDLAHTQALDTGIAGADVVYHVAALTRARTWPAFQSANVDSTRHLLERIRVKAPNLQRIVLTSSLAAVGRSAHAIPDESTPLRPVSMYGRSKMEMEQVAREFNDLPWTIVRPPAVYGPRETDIFTFFQTMSRGICPVVGNGREPALSLVHVHDLVRGMRQASEVDRTVGGTYFLGSREPYSWAVIRDAAATALGRRVVTVPVPRFLVPIVGAATEFAGRLLGTYPAMNREKAAEIMSAATMCDSRLAMDTFGYAPDVDLWEGLQQTMAWYRKAGWLPAGA